MSRLRWWKPEYDELSEYNSERSRAAGVMYRLDASPSERLATRNAAQNWLDSLSPEYVARMERIQADYYEVSRKAFAEPAPTLFGKTRRWWFGR